MPATDTEPTAGEMRDATDLPTARALPGMPPPDPADATSVPTLEETREAATPPLQPEEVRVYRPAGPGAAPTLAERRGPTRQPQPLPAYLRAMPAASTPRGSHLGLWVVTTMTFLLAAVSLAINVLLVQTLAVRGAALRALIDESLAAIDTAASQGIDFSFPIEQTIDFEGDVPFVQDMVFPVKTNVAINTTVRVPVDLGALGTIYVSVPINSTFPVDTEVPVHIEQTIHIKTKVPVKITVPIHLAPDQPPFSVWIVSARNLVARLRQLVEVPEMP